MHINAASQTTSSPVPTSSSSSQLQQAIQQASATLNDTSGQYSDGDKLTAYKTLLTDWNSVGTLDAATQKSANEAFNTSYVQNISAVQNAFIKDISARVTAATTGAGEAQGQLDAYNALSAGDKTLVEPLFHGLTGDQWVAYVTAQKGLGAISDAGLAAGTYKKGASQSSDPRVAAADKLNQEINDGSVWSAAQLNAWTQEANAFLAEQTKTSAVNVTLSPAAQTVVSSAPSLNLAPLKTNSSGLGENVDSTV